MRLPLAGRCLPALLLLSTVGCGGDRPALKPGARPVLMTEVARSVEDRALSERILDATRRWLLARVSS